VLNPAPRNLPWSRYQFAEETLKLRFPEIQPVVVYDIGAGDAIMRKRIEALGLTWIGFDARPSAPEIARWNLDDPIPSAMPKPGAILLLDVIEHLGNPALGLRRIRDAMQAGAVLILTTPNPRWSRSRIHALLKGVPTCFTQADLDFNGHVFTSWPHILERMLIDCGFEIEDYVTLDGKTGWPGAPVTLRYPLRFAHASLNMLIEHLDPTACGMSYGMIATRKG
jgi:hypothetical protein